MTIYERIAKAMQDTDTDYISILINDDGINVYTSLEQDEMMDFFTEMVMLEKGLSEVH
jgi:hypothetical protein